MFRNFMSAIVAVCNVYTKLIKAKEVNKSTFGHAQIDETLSVIANCKIFETPLNKYQICTM